MWQIWRMVLACATALGAGLAHAEVIRYQAVDLGSLGGSFGWASSVNNLGRVVGQATTASGDGYATSFGGSPASNINLGTLGGNLSYANSVNDAGTIVGLSRRADGTYAATLFDGTGGAANLDLGAGSGLNSEAFDLNAVGQIVGYTSSPAYQAARATLFDAKGGGANIDLGSLGGAFSMARAINDLGQIVGQSWTAAGRMHATLFDSTGGGNNVDLGVWPAGNDPYASSVATDINNKGQAVGAVGEPGCCGTGWGVAVLFDVTGNGNNVSLGTLGAGGSSARSINDLGEVVGAAGTSAFLWTSALGMVDLNTLVDPMDGWHLVDAYDINELGQIAAYGYHTDSGRYHAFLLSKVPGDTLGVPEPHTSMLVLLALALMKRSPLRLTAPRGTRT